MVFSKKKKKKKKKKKRQKRADLMHTSIDISFFLAGPHLPFIGCVHCPSTTYCDKWCKSKFAILSGEVITSRYFCEQMISSLHTSQ